LGDRGVRGLFKIKIGYVLKSFDSSTRRPGTSKEVLQESQVGFTWNPRVKWKKQRLCKDVIGDTKT